MPLAEQDRILGEQPPFSPTPPAPVEPLPKHQQILEAWADWTSRRGLLVPLSLFALISFSTYLAYQSQVDDESESLSSPQNSQPDGLSPLPADRGVSSSSTATTVEARSANDEDSSPVSLTTLTTERPRRPTTGSTASNTSTTARRSSTTIAPSTIASTTATTSSTEPPTSSEPSPSLTTTVPSTTTTAPTTTTTAPTTTTTTAPPPPVPGPNELANGGFEQPSVADGQFQFVAPNGWSSSSGSMEVWGNGHNNISAAGGRQFAELNVRAATTISQQVSVTPGATYEWSFSHRGRQDNDTVQVLIGGEVVASATSAPGSWRTVQGTTVIPDGETSITFAIRAVDSGGSGNLVDRARFIRVANP